MKISYDNWQRHDDMGNCVELRSPEHNTAIESGDIYRVSGACICVVCGKDYYSHQPVLGALWLTRLCNGQLVKL